MTSFLAFTIIGLVIGCLYAVTALGLVVTYTTSGVFNFAHGAIGMVAAFAYWELRVNQGWPAPVALVVVLLIGAPLAGAVIERTVIQRLRNASVEVTLVVTLGLLLAILYGTYYVWDPTAARPLPRFFGDSSVRIGSVNVSYHQLVVVVTAIAVALGLRFLLYRSRVGLAMRAVVDNPSLTSLNAVEPDRVSMYSWALGSFLASLAGVLIAPLVVLDAFTLTLLVVNAYAAAMVGRLKSLPMTFLGGLGLGLAVSYATGYLPQSEFWNRLALGIPTIMLFAVLLVFPSRALRPAVGSLRRRPGIPTRSTVTFSAVGFMAVVAAIGALLPVTELYGLGDVLAFGVILLSLVLLTGFGGQVSLCQLSFAGLGAFVVGSVGATPLGFAAAVLVAGAVGALVALPSLRLQGLFLALSTLAFARFMEVVVFPRDDMFGAASRLDVDRFHVGPIDFSGERIHFVFMGAVFTCCAIGLVALRRRALGRRLAAMSDSPTAASTLGIDLTTTKLAVFTLSAAMAGLGGALLAGHRTGVSVLDFTMLGSLSFLLLATLGGIGHVSGAILGSATLGLIAAVKPAVSEPIQRILDLAPGVVVIMILARAPDGVAGWLGRQLEAVKGGALASGRASTGDVAAVPSGNGDRPGHASRPAPQATEGRGDRVVGAAR